ncbi:YfdX family protein [Acetobacter conturbans]|nr:YfdX family protein [Acetobacter conturbans]
MLAAGIAVAPTFAQAASVHTAWEKFKAGRALKHVSADGQRAFGDLLQAHDLLAAGKTEQAIPLLYDAEKQFDAANKANNKLMSAEASLARSPQHPASPDHVASTQQETWIPVGGEFVETETLAPEKKAAVAAANGQLKAGNTQQAAQSMQVVDDQVDFIVALAPLNQTKGAIARAQVFTEGRNPKDALTAVDQALNSLVFVDDDVLDAQAAPAKAAAPAAASAPAATSAK